MKFQCYDPDSETYTVIDTDKAQRVWRDAADWDGRNHIHRSTGDQWVEERLYLSSRGRYYIVTYSAWQGVLPKARFVSKPEAAGWLRLNDHDLPEDLKEYDPTE